MKIFDKYILKKEIMIRKKFEIDNSLYEKLSELSKKKYDASINKLINVAILELIENPNIYVYEKREGEISIPHNFSIRESSYKELEKMRNKYGISIYRLVNIAINNALNS